MTDAPRAHYERTVMPSDPLIGVTPNALPAEDRRLYRNKPLEYGEAWLAHAVRRASGLPILLYRAEAEADDELASQAGALVDRVDGLLFSGGADVSPTSYGGDASTATGEEHPLRDRWELALYRAAVARGRPVLGVCRGTQLINVAEGGTLWPELHDREASEQTHRSQQAYESLQHELILDDPEGELDAVFEGEPLRVNSVHHQGVRELGAALRPVARAPDGLVEAVRRHGRPWVLGVQWHPEWMWERVGQQRLFQRLVQEARSAARPAATAGGATSATGREASETDLARRGEPKRPDVS